MKHNYTDEELQTAIDAATQDTDADSKTIVTRKNYPNTYGDDAKARLHVLKSALDHLPEPPLSVVSIVNFTSAELTVIKELMESQELSSTQVLRQALRHYQMAVQGQSMPPPVVDGKTPGQVAHEAAKSYDEATCGASGWREWQALSHKDIYEVSASGVLAAFGGQASLESAIARIQTVPCPPSGFTVIQWCYAKNQFITAARGEGYKPSQPAEIPWIEWHGGECPLKDEEVAAYGWQFKFRGGAVAKYLDSPSTYRWSHNGNNGDIIAYRVTKWRDDCGPDAVAKPIDWEAIAAKWEREATLQLARAAKAEAELAHAKKDIGFLETRLHATILKTGLSTLRPIAEAGEVPAGCVRYYFQERPNGDFTKFIDSSPTHYADILLPKDQAPTVEVTKPTYVGYMTDELTPETELFVNGASNPVFPPVNPWNPAVGDVVRLKSDGPKMTVLGDKPTCYCAWFTGGEFFSNNFPAAALTQADV